MRTPKRSAVALIALLLASISPVPGCTPPGSDKAPAADTGGGAGVDTAPPADSSAPVDTSTPIDTSTPEDTAAEAICEECVVWAAANDEEFEVTASTDPSDCDGDGYTNSIEATYAYVDEDGALAYTNACLADTDKDGLADAEERGCLNPTLADTDSDGVNDGDEVSAGTDPCVMICEACVEEAEAEGLPFTAVSAEDCDGDGIANAGETEGLPVTSACRADTDSDGLSDSDETGCEDPTKPDSDEDGVDDATERAWGSSSCDTDSDGDGLLDNEETAATVGSDDVDGDGLSDYDEVRVHGTDPADADTDDDCFPDRYEVLEVAVTVGLNAVNDSDSDNDGLLDGEEAWELLHDPAYAAEWDTALGCGSTYVFQGTDPVDNDTDDDLLLDGEEVRPADPADYSSDPLIGDVDGDGLDDTAERAAGTDPYNPDTDSDCLTDGEEVLTVGTSPTDDDHDKDTIKDGDEMGVGCEAYAAITDPFEPDTDFDGIDDNEEQDGTWGYVTDPTLDDSDVDGLQDGAEYSAGTRPDVGDTDEDGFGDGDEVSWGAVSGASVAHYALDALYPEELEGVNDQVECMAATSTKGTTFVTAAGSVSAGDYYYLATEKVIRGNIGTECVCSVTLNDIHPTPITGASVWIETSAHHTTTGSLTPSEWVTDQNPRGVALYLPSCNDSASDSGYRYSLDTTANPNQNFEETEMPAGLEHWYAFNDDPAVEDATPGVTSTNITTSGTPVYVNRKGGASTGTQQNILVIVSKPNDNREDIAYCGHLSNDDGSPTRLKVRLDWYDTLRTTASFTSSGTLGRTEFDLRALSDSKRLNPIPVRGTPRFAGSQIVGLRVVDWRGTARLELQDGTGRVFSLDPSRPQLRPDATPVALAGAAWRAYDAAGNLRPNGPLVEVKHLGTGTVEATPPNSAWISWAHLDQWLKTTAGLDLGALLHRQQPADAAPFRLQLLEAQDGPNPVPPALRIDMPGVGPVMTLPLRALDTDRFAFEIDRPDLRLSGQILVIEEGMFEIRISSGSIGRGSQALVLKGTQLRLGQGTVSSRAN
jgi:hypothetical protein